MLPRSVHPIGPENVWILATKFLKSLCLRKTPCAARNPWFGLSDDENSWDHGSESSKTKVWVNTKSRLYFYPGARWYEAGKGST